MTDKPKNRMKLEKQLEEKCCEYARQKGIVAVKLENVGMVGIPDRMFIKEGGKTLFVEFKSPNGKGVVSPEQKFWLKFLGGAGQVIDDIEEFKKLIDSIYNS